MAKIERFSSPWTGKESLVYHPPTQTCLKGTAIVFEIFEDADECVEQEQTLCKDLACAGFDVHRVSFPEAWSVFQSWVAGDDMLDFLMQERARLNRPLIVVGLGVGRIYAKYMFEYHADLIGHAFYVFPPSVDGVDCKDLSDDARKTVLCVGDLFAGEEFDFCARWCRQRETIFCKSATLSATTAQILNQCTQTD